MVDLPKSNVMGLLVHQPRSVRNGVQKSRNWMLMSIARAWARLSGGICELMRKYDFSVWRVKNVTATTPSAEKDTIGRRTMPNHLNKIIENKRSRDEYTLKKKRENALLFDVTPFAHEFYTFNELWVKGEVRTSGGRIARGYHAQTRL